MTVPNTPGPLGTDWTKFPAWQLVLPPNRPTPASLSRIEAYLSTLGSGAEVAVLGSTIEFRDLLARIDKFRTTVLEKWPQFTRQVDPIRLYHNEEQMVIGDWLATLPQCKSQFDVILSDFTSGNIAYELRADFYAAILDALRPDGVFIDRVLEVPTTLLRLDDLDSRYLRKPSNMRTLNDFSSQYLFLSELIGSTQTVDTTESYKFLRSRNVDQALKRLAELSELVTPSGQIWYYGRPVENTVTPKDLRAQCIYVGYDSEQSVYADLAPQKIFRKPVRSLGPKTMLG
jgi:hypothetical protein